jgi:hypothetical protein
MALSNNDQAQIREYLLGHLSNEDQEKIEVRLMVEDDLFDELEASKDDLIEEYSAGDLSGKDLEWFERNYLASPEGRQRHKLAQALDRLKRSNVAPIPPPVPERPTLIDQLRAFFNWRPWVTVTGTAVLLLGGVTTVIIRNRQPVFVSVTLASKVANRSLGAPQYPQVSLGSETDEVRFSLQLPEYATRRTGYVAELDNQTATTTFTPTVQDQGSVLVVIPATKLPPGFYALSLYGKLPDGTTLREPWEYYFEITK